MSVQSTRKRASGKAATARPKKPYPDFPLSPHASGAWQKKIRGKIHYFGKWGRVVSGKMTRVEGDGWREALELYKAQADDLHAGRVPRAATGEPTVADLSNRFLTAKLHQLNAGELSSRSFDDYKAATDRLVGKFGKGRVVADLRPEDFERLRADLAKQYGPVRLGNEIQRVRTVFKYGYESGLIDRPVRFGPQFKKPSRTVLRKHRAASGQRMFEPAVLRLLLDALDGRVVEVPAPDAESREPRKMRWKPNPTLRAMVLLGVNAGFGNTDVATLPRSAVDLEGGWVRYPRPKTGVERRCALWPETVAAIRAALADRPTPKHPADADLVFVTKYGNRWVRAEGEKGIINSLQLEFGKVLRGLGFAGGKGLSFYSLRHTFRTVADATRDFPAVRLVMGHADDTIDSVYRERIDDSRLVSVAGHVHRWLLGADPI